MKRRPWDDSSEEQLVREMRAAGRTLQEIAVATARSYSSIKNYVCNHHLPLGRRLDAAPSETPEGAPADGQFIASDPLPRPPSVEELLDAFKIDLEEWEVERSKVNTWEMGAKIGEGAAERVVTEPLYQLTIWLKKRRDVAARKLREELLTDLRALPVGPRMRRAGVPDLEAHMLEVAAFDVHFGKLSWGQETGEDWDIRITDEAFRAAIEDLIAKASGYPTDRVLFPVGNDLLQTDNLNRTTTNGTPQDTDSRYYKAFRHAVCAMVWAIRRLRELAPVHVPIIPGNHDRLAAFHIGEVLEAIFDQDPDVTVDNSPSPRKYTRYGTVLLGLTHGSEEKPSDLPLIMAREQAADWAECSVHEWHIGHLHKSKETRFVAGDTFNGVGVRVITALTAADAWHHSKGYVKARRAAEAYLWSKTAGYAGHFASQPILALPRAAA